MGIALPSSLPVRSVLVWARYIEALGQNQLSVFRSRLHWRGTIKY